MKNILTFSTVFALAAIAVTLALELAGLSLPASVGLNHSFALFVVSSTLLTTVSDYSRAGRSRPIDVIAETKSTHPLAA
jgi:hypothetical protein